jgi:hypothetical protein
MGVATSQKTYLAKWWRALSGIEATTVNRRSTSNDRAINGHERRFLQVDAPHKHDASCVRRFFAGSWY